MNYKQQTDSSFDSDLQFLALDNIYICIRCQSHLSAKQFRISNQFQGKYGVAYLQDKAFNVLHKPPKDVTLMTGKHTTSDVICKGCKTYVGWKYVFAEDESNKYKINKYVIEKAAIKNLAYYKQD